LFNEVYSNADATVQFIEMFTSVANQEFTSGQSIEATQGGSTNTFVFPSNTPAPTAGHHLLLATAGFAELPGVPTPDFIIPDNFMFQPNGMVELIGPLTDSITYTALPSDGTYSLAGDGTTTQISSPKNYGDETLVDPLALTDPIAESITKGSIPVELEVIALGLVSPILLVDPNDGTEGLYIVIRQGRYEYLRMDFCGSGHLSMSVIGW
jgi:hypothetical protein